MVDAICPKCGHHVTGPDHLAGLITACRKCGQAIMLSRPRVAPNWANRPVEPRKAPAPAQAAEAETTDAPEAPVDRPSRRRKARPFTYQAAGAPSGKLARRRHARYMVNFPVRIRSLSGRPYDGMQDAHTMDLSGGGARIVTGSELPVKSMLDLEIELPRRVGNIAVRAEVVHAKPGQAGTELGCEFLGNDPSLAYTVQEALQAAGLDPSKAMDRRRKSG